MSPDPNNDTPQAPEALDGPEAPQCFDGAGAPQCLPAGVPDDDPEPEEAA